MLCKMHERQQITGGDLDGPMTLTAAIKPEVAKRIYPESSVAGRANILMVPNLEAANMLVRQLAHLSHAEIAGIVLGCKVPVILSNPTDGARTRVASVALARLLVKA